MYSKEEILKALQTIKGVCEEQDMCLTCPLRADDQGYCAIETNNIPSEWKLKPREENWRAFED